MSKRYDLREAVKEKTPNVVACKMIEAIQRKENPLRLSIGSDYNDDVISIQELFFIFTGEDHPRDGLALGSTNIFEKSGNVREDISSTAFAVITGNLMQRLFIDSFDEVPRIGPLLAANFNSKLKVDSITGFVKMDLPDLEIQEGEQYPDFGIHDKYVEYGEPAKHGGIVRITAETIHFDQTGQIVTRIQELAVRLATRQEWEDIGKVFDGFFDDDNTKGVYFPSGSVQDLYSSGNNNLVTGASSNISLTNGTDTIRTSRNQFLSILDDSEDQFPILHAPDTILAGDTDGDVLNVLMNSAGDPGSANLRLNILSSPRHKYTVLTSPLVDYHRSNTTGVEANAWLMGQFKKQFERKVIFPLRTWIKRGGDTDDGMNKDIEFTFKASIKERIYARAKEWVVKNKGEA